MTSTMEELLKSRTVDWAAVQRRIEENPDEIRWVDSRKHTVLHFACYKKALLDVVAFLLEKHPDAATAKDYLGWLPLHRACSYGQSVAVIELLVEAYPDSLNVTNGVGKTPLSYAKDKDNADITAYLETVTPEIVKTRTSDKRIPAMVVERITAMVDKKLNKQTNKLSTLTTNFKTDHESKLYTLTTDLGTCNKKNADMEKEVNSIIENKLSALTAELRTVNQNTKKDLKKCNENIADLEKVVKENITAKVVECIAAMVNNKINEQTNEISNLKVELKKGNEMTLSILTAELKTANKNLLSNLTSELKKGIENTLSKTLSALTADLITCFKNIADTENKVNINNEKTVSALTTELKTDNENTLSTHTAELKKSYEYTLSNVYGTLSQSEELIATTIDKKLKTLEISMKTDNKTIEADLKRAKWQGIFFFVLAQLIFSNTNRFLSAQPNTTNVSIVDDTMFLDRHDGSTMGILPSTFMFCYRRCLVFFCVGILGSVLIAPSKYFIMIYHASLKQAFNTWHKAFDLLFCLLESVKVLVPSP